MICIQRMHNIICIEGERLGENMNVTAEVYRESKIKSSPATVGTDNLITQVISGN